MVCCAAVFLLALVGVTVAIFYVPDTTSSSSGSIIPISDEFESVRKILEGENLMTPTVSKEWGLKAHALTNAYRTKNGLAELEWSP